MKKDKKSTIRNLMESTAGSFTPELGIDLESARPEELFRWLLASMLFGARISEKIAIQTFLVFNREKVTSPKDILDRGWDGLVQILDEGGYTRYDFKTATKILDVVQSLQLEYDGDLNRLHGMAQNNAELENRLQSLAQGIGQVTTNIFLRELRESGKRPTPFPAISVLLPPKSWPHSQEP